MKLKLAQIDAFTDTPFKGNPAAVCMLEKPMSDQWMQNLAKEMNLSETAFLLKEATVFNLRWFTPNTEVKLCGHATLASAHALWEWNCLKQHDEAKFSSLSGHLTAHRTGNWIELDFPARFAEPSQYPDTLFKGLGIAAANVFYDRVNYLVVLDSEQAVRDLHPDFAVLREVVPHGVIVTARSTSVDFVSRFFAPRIGVNEDPVTGSAHCCLATYWSEVLNKKELIGYQASERGGTVKTRIVNQRVFLGGQAVTIFLGELHLPL